MKLLSPPLAAVTLSLLAALPALAMDQRQADAICAAWKLECPSGATATSSGPGKGTGALTCKLKGRPVKEGPSVSCKDGKALAWGGWKAGKKHGLQVTLSPDGSWMEEHFAGGRLHGRSVEYSAEGQLLRDTSFRSGKKHGPSRTFQEDGRLTSEEHWERGVRSRKPMPTMELEDLSLPTPEAPPAPEPSADEGAASATEEAAQGDAPEP